MSSITKKSRELKLINSAREFYMVCAVLLLILIVFIFSSCSKTEVDLRTLAPKDTIIYLQTNDLGNTLDALTQSRSFKEVSASKADFSAIDGIQVAVAVSGFETSENQVTDEQSVLNFKPKFTAIAETHAWSWQVNSLVENNLDNFVKKNYGNDAKLEKKSVNDTERFIWTASDGRKTFAVISDSQVFFGNDEESINRCLLAKRGEAESLLKNESLSLEYEKAEGKLAFGFISNDGIRQIADLVGVSVAVGQTEDSNARGFIARILPQILNNTTREVIWTAEKTENSIEDHVFIKTSDEVSSVLSETLVPANRNINELYEFLPLETSSVTRYNLKNPQVAFRSLLLITAKNTDAINGKIISAFSNTLLLQYGIADAEGFLSSVESELLTAKVGEDKSVAFVKAKDLEKIKTTFIEEIKPQTKASEKTEIWQSAENDLSVAFSDGILIMGDSEGVLKSLEISKKRKLSPIEADRDFTKSRLFAHLLKSESAATTFTNDLETAENIAKVFGSVKDKEVTSNLLIETQFTKQGIERKYISDYGFLGTIIEQFANE